MDEEKERNGVEDELIEHTLAGKENLEAMEADGQGDVEKCLDGVALSVSLRDIRQHYVLAIGALSKINSFFKEPQSCEVEAALDAYQDEENQIFSRIPDYIQNDADLRKQRKLKLSKTIKARIEAYLPSDIELHDFSNYSRQQISSEQPLPLPFDLKRTQNRKGMDRPGTYHDLFYGDGSNCLFSPPPDKRALVEARKEKRKEQRTEPRRVDPPRKKKLIVDSNFVPACARVDHTAAQEELRGKREQKYGKKNVEASIEESAAPC